MSSQNNLEINGNLSEHPLAELSVEVQQAKLSGSLRLVNGGQKIIVYFDAGDVVFAVSNSRQHRLYELLLREKIVTKQQLLSIPDFTDDLALSRNLITSKLLAKTDINALFRRQIEEILQTVFDWQEGTWIFSPHIRVKDYIQFKIDLPQLLIKYARKLSAATVVCRFKSLKETFVVKSTMPAGINLLPPEAFVFSRFEHSLMTIERVSAVSGMAEDETLKILYMLWFGGFLIRQDWNSAFTKQTISAILAANFTLKKVEKTPAVHIHNLPAVQTETEETPILEIDEPVPSDGKLSLEDYLHRIENANNHYETLDITLEADAAKIKQAYFALAKQFHPDLFYKKTDAKTFQQIQSAFTSFAHAYETLRNESSREVYDYRMRKELAEMALLEETGVSPEETNLQKQTDQAADNFKQGFDLLMAQHNEAAIPFLARAVHFAPDNARYHAYHGKVLSYDKAQRHKAESELQTAIKLDGENVDYRIMLAEFFIQIGFIKRAEGELNRLLAIFPNNKEAQVLLDSLAKS
ncbi:MAG: DUF4388 domain-containing protein [Acidobacteriota bacterium]